MFFAVSFFMLSVQPTLLNTAADLRGVAVIRPDVVTSGKPTEFLPANPFSATLHADNRKDQEAEEVNKPKILDTNLAGQASRVRL